MGRIIIRKSKRNLGNDSRIPARDRNDDAGIDAENERDGIEGTGEPDESGTNTASGDQPPSGGIDGNGTEFVDPASGGSRTGAGTGTGKRRGRPRGSRNAVRQSPSKATEDISGLLFSLHLGMATFLKSEVMAITQEESDRLAAALVRVSELYDIRIVPEKYMAWINLATVGGSIYGPRIMAASLKKKKPQPEPVTIFPSPVAPGVN